MLVVSMIVIIMAFFFMVIIVMTCFVVIHAMFVAMSMGMRARRQAVPIG